MDLCSKLALRAKFRCGSKTDHSVWPPPKLTAIVLSRCHACEFCMCFSNWVFVQSSAFYVPVYYQAICNWVGVHEVALEAALLLMTSCSKWAAKSLVLRLQSGPGSMRWCHGRYKGTLLQIIYSMQVIDSTIFLYFVVLLFTWISKNAHLFVGQYSLYIGSVHTVRWNF